jgi:hypothetical protein
MREVIATPPPAAEMLEISGDDATTFLHAQLSSDVRMLEAGRWQWSAWLDAQGRVRVLLQLARVDDTTYLALLRGGAAADMAAALGRYVLRARVVLRPRGAILRAAAALPLHTCAGAAPGNPIAFGMGTHAWSIGAAVAGDAGGTGGADAAWRCEIDAGWPWLPDTALDALMPPALGLEHLGAVSFDKGCYPGQEIAARLHYRGGNKRHLVTLAGAADRITTLLHTHPDALLALSAQQSQDLHVLGVLNGNSAAVDAFAPLIQSRHAG